MITSLTIGALSINTGDNYALIAEQGLSLPPMRHAGFNLAGEHFGAFVSSFYGARRFSLDILVVGSSISDFQTRRTAIHQAFDALQGEQILTFTLSDGRSVSLRAIAVSCDFPLKAGIPTAGECHVELEAAFPFFLSANPVTVLLTLPTGGGGTVPFPEVPASLSMGSGGSTSATNNGTAPAYPTIRLAGPVTNPAVRNETTGEEMRFLIALAAGEYLDIDVRKKTVTDSAGVNRYAARLGDWWMLAPGSSVLSFRADSSDPLATAAITFADTYLAL